MSAPLHEAQARALAWRQGKRKVGYFLEMGLGKTYLSLVDFMQCVAEGKVTQALVICPNSFKSGWVDEIQDKDISVAPFVYSSRDRFHPFLTERHALPPVVIVNFEAIRSGQVVTKLIAYMSKAPTFLIIDESIQIKTPRAKQTKGAHQLAAWAKEVRLLSGLPSTQGPHDLWSQLSVIGAPVGGFYSFRNKFCEMGGYMGKQVVGARDADKLSKLMAPHVFFAKKADFTDLPPKVYTTRAYEMGVRIKKLYKSMRDDFVAYLSDERVVTVDVAIAKYRKMAQIQSGFIIDGDRYEDLEPALGNTRIAAVRDILETELDGKACVVYVHRHAKDLLVEALADFNPAVMSGGMSKEAIDEQKAKFAGDPSCRIFLLQHTVGKYGHTLLGGPEKVDNCATMIFFETSYSLDDRSQIEDRIHRYGQKAEQCLYIDLVGSPLDRAVAKALQSKKDIFKAIFDGLKQEPTSKADA